MQENSQNIKAKAVEQALASLRFDDIDLTPEFLEQYAQKHKIELKSEKVMKKVLKKEEGKQ